MILLLLPKVTSLCCFMKFATGSRDLSQSGAAPPCCCKSTSEPEAERVGGSPFEASGLMDRDLGGTGGQIWSEGGHAGLFWHVSWTEITSLQTPHCLLLVMVSNLDKRWQTDCHLCSNMLLTRTSMPLPLNILIDVSGFFSTLNQFNAQWFSVYKPFIYYCQLSSSSVYLLIIF